MVNELSNNNKTENGNKKQIQKKKSKSEIKEENDLKKRIQQIHAGEKLAPIAKNFKQVDSGKRIRIYRNGDAFHKGINIVLNMRHVHDINTFLETISEKIGLIHGAKKLYTLQGHLIRSTNELENNNEYVASSAGFTLLPYGSTNNREWHSGHFARSSSSAVSKELSSISLTASKKSAPGRLSAVSRQSRSTEPKQHQKQRNVPATKTRTSTRKEDQMEKLPKNAKSKSPINNHKKLKNKPNSKKQMEADEHKKKIHTDEHIMENESPEIHGNNEEIQHEKNQSPKSRDGIDDSSSQDSEETKKFEESPRKDEEYEKESNSEILSAKSKKSKS